MSLLLTASTYPVSLLLPTWHHVTRSEDSLLLAACPQMKDKRSVQGQSKGASPVVTNSYTKSKLTIKLLGMKGTRDNNLEPPDEAHT